MPLETVTTAWQSALLVADEIWQARTPNAQILVTAETPVGGSDLRGVLLHYGEARLFRAGQTVSWRALNADTNVALHHEVYL